MRKRDLEAENFTIKTLFFYKNFNKSFKIFYRYFTIAG